MSAVNITGTKQYLRVIHNSDDALIQALIDSAEDEICLILNRTELPRRAAEADSNDPGPASDSDDVAPAVRNAVWMLVQAGYDAADAQQMQLVRQAVETKVYGYRQCMGA